LITLVVKQKTNSNANCFFFSFQTALHWASKHGNENVIKLIAGKHKADVNSRTVSKGDSRLFAIRKRLDRSIELILIYHFNERAHNRTTEEEQKTVQLIILLNTSLYLTRIRLRKWIRGLI